MRPVDSLTGQPATEHVDPHIEGVEVRVMATAIETDPVCLGPAPDQCFPIVVAEHSMLREHRECRDRQSLPLVPAGLVHRLDHALHDGRAESRDETVVRPFEVCQPGIEGGVPGPNSLRPRGER